MKAGSQSAASLLETPVAGVDRVPGTLADPLEAGPQLLVFLHAIREIAAAGAGPA